MTSLPSLFLERLQKILPPTVYSDVLKTFSLPKQLTLRLNPLRQDPVQTKQELRSAGLVFDTIDGLKHVLILKKGELPSVILDELIQSGAVYIQNLSSLLVPLILDPKPGDRILDLCAAPGSKTTQIAAITENRASIVAVEAIKNRFYRLKSVIHLLGAENIEVKLMDGRRFRPKGDALFDRVLVDAPCSSEGRFHTASKKSLGYWSLRKIKEMQRKQKGLLLNAARHLKPGGVLVYSTCTFAPEENEAVIDWLLRKMPEELTVKRIDINLKSIKTYPAIQQWQQKILNPHVQYCVRFLPDQRMDGFFVAKIIKN